MSQVPPSKLSEVAKGLREVARVAAEGDGAYELLDAAMDGLQASLPVSHATYLALRGERLVPRYTRPERGLGEKSLAVSAHPALGAVLVGGRAAGLPDADLGSGDLTFALRDVDPHGLDDPPGLLVPVKRGDEPTGLLALSLGGDNVASEAALQIATVYGALLGVGLAAIDRASRLELLRKALEERNQLLTEDVSADAAACDALEASVSRRMRTLVRMTKQVATTDAPVLITGETGTGKEVLARAIHEWSARSEGPFVQLNCAALSDHLIESELFGHVKGAFSGAVRDRPGRFRAADGGTLLLDEIGEMPMDAQTKLLRVLEEGTVVPVGSDRGIDVDVRVVAATNVDLELAIDRGRFREDLYFRLHVFPLHLPPLRERLDDLPVLIDRILRRIQRRTGHGPWRVEDAAVERLRSYPWPGNVRELVNALERARVFSPLGGTLELDVGRGGRRKRRSRRREWPTLEQHQRAYIEEVLRQTRGKIYGPSGAAEILGLPPSTLQSRMKRLGVERPSDSRPGPA